MFGLTLEQLSILAGAGVGLLVLLLVFRTVLKLTKTVLRFGCLSIIVILAVAFALMRGFGG